MTNLIRQLLVVSASDPDNQRKAQLLNILLLGTGLFTLLSTGFTVATLVGQPIGTEFLLIVASIFAIVGITFLLWVNRRGKTKLAGWLFILLMVLVITFGDAPDQVVSGRSLFLFAIPVLMSSVILTPRSSFMVAFVVDIALFYVSFTANLALSVVVILGFFILALVSWLSARSLEEALTELREINEDLDKRVEARTAELKITNSLLEEQIVERQRAAEALRIARDQALDASRFKTELLAKVSHELRTPLGVILGFAEMMTAGIYGPVTAKQQDVLSKIIERDKRLTHLVGDLLDQSQFESRQIKLKSDPIMPRQIVENARMSLQELADRKNIELAAEIDETVPRVLMGDGQRVEQIVINLVNNALKFTEDGYVQIAVSVRNDDQWVIEVTDSGIGIPEKAQRYIFEAFRQVDGSATRNHEGFGLGLSIVKQLVDAMEGTITLNSQVGQGTTFTVTLPLKPVDLQENVP